MEDGRASRPAVDSGGAGDQRQHNYRGTKRAGIDVAGANEPGRDIEAVSAVSRGQQDGARFCGRCRTK